MKKNLIKIALFSACIIGLQSCESRKVIVNREVESSTDGQLLLGTQTRSQFQKAPFSDWFDPEYANYQLDQDAISGLKKEKLKSCQITVFVGTWCGDSHREFPRLMKILDEINFPENRLTIIAVNRKKESPNGEEAIFNIQRVPTIIVRKYGKEVGRIIEYPKSGFLERDLLDIIK